MPLGKQANRERMRKIRLHSKNNNGFVQPKTPIYNPSIHNAGDRVMINGRAVTVPGLDADGNPIWD